MGDVRGTRKSLSEVLPLWTGVRDLKTGKGGIGRSKTEPTTTLRQTGKEGWKRVMKRGVIKKIRSQ